MLVLIDGPEKAGKTTLIKQLENECNESHRWAKVEVIKQGPWNPDDSIIAEQVRMHTSSDHLYIWDRGWASEYVYATGLNRPRRANNNLELMEWLHGRATPYKFILLPEDAGSLYARRDATDLPIDPKQEIKLFCKFAGYTGYTYLVNNYSPDAILFNTAQIIRRLLRGFPKYLYGSPNSSVLFVTNKDTGNKGDRWMPLSYTAANDALTECFGIARFSFAYAFSNRFNPALLHGRTVVTVGKEATDWVSKYVTPVAIPKLHRLKKDQLGVILTKLKEIQNG